MNEEITLLDRLTGDILEQKRLASGSGNLNKENTQIHKWIHEVCAPYKKRNINLELKITGPDRSVLIDNILMEMVLRNLIQNCIKHAPSSAILITLDTTKNKEGFGFGLSIVKTIIKLHGANLCVRNTAPKGFLVLLEFE